MTKNVIYVFEKFKWGNLHCKDREASADEGDIFMVEIFFLLCSSHFKDQDSTRNMGILELVPVRLAIKILSNDLKNRKLLFNVDNLSMFTVINKRTT